MASRTGKNRRRRLSQRISALQLNDSAVSGESSDALNGLQAPELPKRFEPADWAGSEGEIGRYITKETGKILNAYIADPDGLDEDAQAERSLFRGGYAKRQLVELVQNSSDALKYKGGRIEVRITDDHLYCADEGTPITAAGVRSLMRAHLSSKHGTEFIGQFGLGFKSVLAITDAPEFFSRSGAFRFDRTRAERRIRERIAGDHPCPVLRLPEPVDPIEQSAGDAVLREMMSWATNIVRLPLNSDAYPRLQPQMDEFRPECLFFTPGVNRLTLIDDADDWSADFSVEQHAGELSLESGGPDRDPTKTRWKLYSKKIRLSTQARRQNQIDLGDEDEIEVSWAVPVDRRMEAGRFWTYFPTARYCLVAGIVNARWQTYEDRQSLHDGLFNDELIEAAAELISANLHQLSSATDPALHLDALPKRPEDGDDPHAVKLRHRLFQLLHGSPIIPDLQGNLQPYDAIRYPPSVGTGEQTREAYDQWFAVNRRDTRWLHPQALRNTERFARVERLCDENGIPPNQRGSGAPRASIAEWLEVLVDEVAEDEAVEASKAAIRIAAELPSSSYRFEHRDYGKIILTQNGDFASPNGSLYLPTAEGADWPGRTPIHHELANDPLIRRKLLELGVQEASPETRFESLLNRTIPKYAFQSRKVSDDRWDAFWKLSRSIDVEMAARKIANRSGWRANLSLKTVAGTWKPVHSVLLPGAVVLDDSSRDEDIAVDIDFHRQDMALIESLSILDRPHDDWDLYGEPGYKDHLRTYSDKFQDHGYKSTGQRPQLMKVDFESAKGVGPVHVFSLLSEEGKARFTKVLISEKSTFVLWEIRHDTQHQYGTMPVPQLAIPTLKEHGRIQTPAGIVSFVDALGENPASPEAQRILLDHPNVELIRTAFDLHEPHSIYPTNSEPCEPILEVWPGLHRYISDDQTRIEISRCRWFEDEYGLRVDERSVLIDNLIYLSRMDDIDELREVCSILHISLDDDALYGVLDQPTPREIEEARNEVARQTDDAHRLLTAVGVSNLRSELPDTLIVYYERNGTAMSGVDLADAAIATYHTGALKQYLHFLKHLNPPKRWTSGPKTVDFVRSLGFSKEWAGDPSSSLDPFVDVPGPFNLEKAHKYQRTIIDELRGMLAGSPYANANRRALISLPTGSGKTRVAVQGIVEAMRDDGFNGGVLWVADREELCEQAIESWQQVWSAIGSERKTLRVSRMWGNQPRPSSTSEFHVVVATIQTLLSRFVKRSYGYEFLRDFTMVVFDEAHRSTARSFSDVMRDIGFSRPQHPTDPFLLGLTATPYRGRDQVETKRLVDTYGNNRLDRDAFPTNNADDVVRELQRMNVLAYAEHDQIVGSEFELSEEERLQAQRTPWLSPNTEIRIARDAERTERIIDAYKEHIASQPETWPTLIFATSVEHAQTLAAILSADGISARAVSGGTDRYTRRQVVEQFRAGKLQVLVNYGVFREGFDAPKTRAIIVARPVYSPNLYFQMIGRGLRGIKNGGNDRCLILDVNDNIVNFERNLAFTELDWLWD